MRPSNDFLDIIPKVQTTKWGEKKASESTSN